MDKNTYTTGQRVICLTALYSAVTCGKEYEVVTATPEWVCLVNDRGDFYEYPAPFFTPALEKAKGPIVIDNENVYAFDVDDTLVIWGSKYFEPADDRIRIIDPYDGSAVYLKPHERHVKLLQQMHGRGRHILVWSQGGAQWAKAVVDALGLASFVHTIVTKPSGYVDDLPVDAWLKNHIYLKLGDE